MSFPQAERACLPAGRSGILLRRRRKIPDKPEWQEKGHSWRILLNPKNAFGKKIMQACIEKKLYLRHLCKTADTQKNSHGIMHNILISL
jgi:hypothetical protein